ncbi:hypothetical protein D3C73_1406870 [compost metagenome]
MKISCCGEAECRHDQSGEGIPQASFEHDGEARSGDCSGSDLQPGRVGMGGIVDSPEAFAGFSCGELAFAEPAGDIVDLRHLFQIGCPFGDPE